MLRSRCRDAPGVGGRDARADAGAVSAVANAVARRQVEALAVGGRVRRRRQSGDDVDDESRAAREVPFHHLYLPGPRPPARPQSPKSAPPSRRRVSYSMKTMWPILPSR